MDYALNIKGQLFDLSQPQVMGILNVTPDSFYEQSRAQTEETIAQHVRQMVADGASIIDIGACSTRPGSTPVSEKEEMARLRMALKVIASLPEIYSPSSLLPPPSSRPILSIDTFRPDVARMVVEEFGADIINDVGAPSGSQPSTPNDEMLRMVSRLGVPYILMSSQSTLRDTLLFFAERVQRLRDMGQKDIILDPGFGFGKTVEGNYALMNELEKLQVMELPVLVGISRKSMIWRQLGCQPVDALNGTTVLNTIALMKGANILRVHDVKEAVECVKIVAATLSQHTGHDCNRHSLNKL